MDKQNYLPGSLRLHRGGFLNKDHVKQFLRCAHRAECLSNPIVYCKAIRATFLAFGFDPDWVETEFRDMLENEYIYHVD